MTSRGFHLFLRHKCQTQSWNHFLPPLFVLGTSFGDRIHLWGCPVDPTRVCQPITTLVGCVPQSGEHLVRGKEVRSSSVSPSNFHPTMVSGNFCAFLSHFDGYLTQVKLQAVGKLVAPNIICIFGGVPTLILLATFSQEVVSLFLNERGHSS